MAFDKDWQPYQAPATQVRTESRPADGVPHSGFGITSFVLGLLAGVGIFVLIAIATVYAAMHGGEMAQDAPEMLALGLVMLGLMGLTVLGGVFGFIGVLLPGRKKIFAILGLLGNGLIVLGIIGLMIIGMLAS